MTIAAFCSQNNIVAMITNIANASFNSGRFPAKLKLGQITPLLKKAGLDATDDCNFRPISNLPTMSKLLERLALSRLQPHLLSSPNYSTLQSAYRSLHSTETALLKVTDEWYLQIDGQWFLHCPGQPRHLCCLRYHWSQCSFQSSAVWLQHRRKSTGMDSVIP